MEIVDIVDENDNVINSLPKSEAHTKGLLHRTVIAEIINSNGEWMLVKQAADRQDPGQFVSPVGGHVTAGETPEDALKREAFEETGIKNFTYTYVGKAIFTRKVLDRLENHYFIVYEIYTDDELMLNEESVEYKKFSQKELKRIYYKEPMQFGDAFHFVLKNFYPEILASTR